MVHIISPDHIELIPYTIVLDRARCEEQPGGLQAAACEHETFGPEANGFPAERDGRTSVDQISGAVQLDVGHIAVQAHRNVR